MKPRLQWAADAATAVVAVVVVAVLGARFFDRGGPPDAQLDGQAIGIDFAAAEHTLVMVLRSDCTFCEQSKPFYARLGESRAVQIAIAAPPGDGGIAGYASILAADVVVFPTRETLPVSSTPSLLLVDREGVVEAAWMGLLDARREDEVLAAVSG